MKSSRRVFIKEAMKPWRDYVAHKVKLVRKQARCSHSLVIWGVDGKDDKSGFCIRCGADIKKGERIHGIL